MDNRVCPTCGEANPSTARLCGVCGTSLIRDEAAGEVRREITLVTSDLKGSTALGERLDPEALREVLNRYFAVMRAVFESHGGTIEKIIGDAIVAVFGLPFRHDDDPIRALEAAAESQRALVTLNDELEQGWGVRLTVRTGVASGEVTFGRAEGGQHVLLGPPVDVSGVMEQNAPSYEVLVDSSTVEQVGDIAEFETMDPVSPKGSDEKLAAYRLVAVKARAAAEEAAAEAPVETPGMRICPSCGEQSPDRYRFCNTCGASLTEHVARETRRTVSLVFAMPKVHAVAAVGEAAGDGHGAVADGPSPEALRDVMSTYFEAMRTALERHGGTVEKFIGDAVMAVFGLPVRHEDDAVRAIRAAADMQAALPALNAGFRAERGLELENHIGVNTGEVIAGDASTGQRLVTGDAVNTAARLEQAAGSGEIVLGDLTYRLARDQIDVEFIPPLTLKGKAEPVPAYRLVRVGAATAARPVDTTTTATPFVGREAEMGRLGEALADAQAKRGARLITLVGDAGVGKSRLIREFATQAAKGARVLRGRCLPYGDGITFWPLAEVVREAAAIVGEDTPNIAIRKIRRLCSADDAEAIVERVAAAMNLSSAQFPVAELMWGGRRLLESLAHDRPLAMIIDDIHSAETTFLDFIDHLLEAVEGAPLLLLCSARHEIAERHAEWLEAHDADTIRLEPLSETDSGRIVEELLGSLDASVRERITAVSEGNPLYVEQIVSMLIETGAIQRGIAGWVARSGSEGIRIPPTVEALVASRLDALGPEERAVVEPGAVIGLSFPMDAVGELVDAAIRDALEAELTTLVGKELVRKVPGEEAIYRFGHQIIRDTAYGGLLKRVRAALHERFVVWAERVNRERGRETEFEEILGYHLEQAYRYRTEIGVIDAEARSVGERAAEKLASAGRRAFERGDMPAASSLLRRAIDLLPARDPRRLELIPDLAESFVPLSRFEDAAPILEAGETEATEASDERAASRIGIARLLVGLFSGSDESSETVAATATAYLDRLTAIGDEGGMARALRILLLLAGNAGRYDEAARTAEQLISHAERAGEARLVRRGAAVYASAAVLGSTRVDRAMAECLRLVEEVRGDRRAEAAVEGALAQLHAMRGEFEAGRAAYRRGQELLRDLGASREASSTSIEASRVEVLAGDLSAAEAELRRDYGELEAMGERYFRSTVAGLLARVLWLAGQADEAATFAASTQELSDPDDAWSQVLWRVVRARLDLDAGQAESAIRLAKEALDLAAETADLELRADTLRDLAPVPLDGTSVEARRLGEAIALYEAKGDVVSAETARARLRELGSATLAG
jgi:class 3 adenylate cyclase/tetratricopeptide (TPR) repeat protein